MSEAVLSAAGIPLTAEELQYICHRDPVNRGVVITPEGKRLGQRGLHGKYAREVLDYVTGVSCGEIIAGIDRILACIRYLRMMDDPAYDVSCKDADFVIGIIESTFKHRQGETLDGRPLRGQPMLLEPWQKFIVYGILTFRHAGTALRVVHELCIFIPRKNGKTTFLAGIAYGMALLDRLSGAKVYVVAETLKQARETFDTWVYNISSALYPDKKAAAKAGWRIADNSMEHSVSNGSIAGGSISLNALAGNGDNLDSFNCNFAIADETHAYKSPQKYNRMKEATKGYSNKITAMITTAGDNGNGFCAQRIEYCRKVLRGVFKDDEYFIFLCSMDQDENGNVDFTNPVQHEKANPNYRVTIRPEDILNASLQALNDPQSRKDFLSRQGNVFTAAVKAWFNVEEFRRSNKKAGAALGIDPDWKLEKKLQFLAKLPGVQWYGGADLSKLYDLTAAVLHGCYKGIDIVIPHCWFPITEASRKADRDNIPLFGWKDDGWLDMCNAPTNDHTAVVRWFEGMRKMGFHIAQVGHDRKFCREYFVGMKKAGFNIIDQPQYFYKKSEGFRHIENRVQNDRLYYLGAEPYEYCVSNVHAIEKTDDMVQYEKINPDRDRIDVFDADVFACVRMLENMERAAVIDAWRK